MPCTVESIAPYWGRVAHHSTAQSVHRARTAQHKGHTGGVLHSNQASLRNGSSSPCSCTYGLQTVARRVTSGGCRKLHGVGSNPNLGSPEGPIPYVTPAVHSAGSTCSVPVPRGNTRDPSWVDLAESCELETRGADTLAAAFCRRVWSDERQLLLLPPPLPPLLPLHPQRHSAGTVNQKLKSPSPSPSP